MKQVTYNELTKSEKDFADEIAALINARGAIELEIGRTDKLIEIAHIQQIGLAIIKRFGAKGRGLLVSRLLKY